MKTRSPLLLLVFAISAILPFLTQCAGTPELNKPALENGYTGQTADSLLWNVLQSEHKYIRTVMADPARFEVQLIFTEITRDDYDHPIFANETFQLNDNAYFYPASTVKMPAAFLAAELFENPDPELAVVERKIPLTLDTEFRMEEDTARTTLRQEITKIFVVSDNDAHNRMHDLIGRDRFNTMMIEKGLGPWRQAHRLGGPSKASAAEHRGIWFFGANGDSLFFQREPAAELEPLDIDNLQKGVAYMQDGEKIEEPFGFAYRNHAPLASLQATLEAVIFPGFSSLGRVSSETVAKPGSGTSGLQTPEMATPRFHLSDETVDFLNQAMRWYPDEGGYDDPDYYYDGYVKFFIYGDVYDPIPDHVKIANKVGFAYGTLTDVAYITDSLNGIEFMLSGTIIVNKNGTFNDNVYEYDEVGMPFLAEVGRQIYQRLLEEKQAK